MDEFEKMNRYMEKVDDDIVLEATGVEHPDHPIEDGGDDANIRYSYPIDDY